MLLHFLNSVSPLSPALQEHLSSILKVKELSRKDFLLKPGNISREVCFISKGLLRCFYEDGDREVSRWFMKEGDVIFSISSFYDQIQSIEFIQAIEDTTVYYISHSELEEVYDRYTQFERIGRLLTIKYYKLWDQLLYVKGMQTASERYDWLLNHHPELLSRVPAKHIATYLGVTEVTLSRIKSRFFY